MLTLGIDTSGATLAVGLARGDEVLADSQVAIPNSHSRLLPALIDDLCRYAQCDPKQLELVAVAAGPGSFTGLRLGAMAGKVVAWHAGAPMVAVNSMHVLARAAVGYGQGAEGFGWVVLLPSRRRRVYGRGFSFTPPGTFNPLGPMHENEIEAVLQVIVEEAGKKPLFLMGAGGRSQEKRIQPLLPAGSRWAPPGADLPRGSWAARLGQASLADAMDPLAFTPAYLGSTVPGPGGSRQ